MLNIWVVGYILNSDVNLGKILFGATKGIYLNYIVIYKQQLFVFWATR